jgi:WD40 repeat protein
MLPTSPLDRILIGWIVLIASAGTTPGMLYAQSSPARHASPSVKVDLYGDPLPPRAVLRLGTVKYRQDSPIHRLAPMPDGKHFVTDGEDSILRVWDAAGGRVIRRIDPEVGALADFAIMSHGKLVMALGTTLEPGHGYVQHVTMTELETGRPVDVGTWPADGHGLHPIALCPDRQLVAMGMDAHSIRVLDAWTGAEICRFETGTREAECIVFSRDGKRLAVETRSHDFRDRQVELRLYDLEQRKESRVIRQDGFSLSDLAFSPDASTIAATTLPDLHIWSVGTGEHIPFPKAFVDHVSYSADGRTLVGLAGFGSIGVFDLAARRKVDSFLTGVFQHGDVVLSLDGRTLLASSGEGVLHEWDLKTRQDRFAMPDAHGEPVKTVVVTPDGKTVITGSADKTVRLWDLATGKLLRVLPLSGRVETTALSPDGRWLAAATFMFHQVFVWDLQSRSGPVVLAAVQSGHAVSPLALRFVDGNTILLIDQAGNLHELDVNERRHRAGARLEVPAPDPDLRPPGDIRLRRAVFLPDGRRIAADGHFSGVHVADIATGKDLLHLESGDLLVPSPDGRALAVTTSESEERFKRWDRMAGRRTGLEMESSAGTIRLLDTGTGKELCWIKVEGSKVWGLAFSPDGKTLAATTGWESGRIHLYDIPSGRETRTIDAPATHSPALAFTPDGTRLVTAMADGSILVWGLRPGP